MLKVTIKYYGDILEEVKRFQMSLMENDVKIIKTTQNKAVVYVKDDEELKDLIFNLNRDTRYGVVASKVKEVKPKSTFIETLVCISFTGLAAIGLGTVVNYIVGVIMQWLV